MRSQKGMFPFLLSLLLTGGIFLSSVPVQAKELMHAFDFAALQQQPLETTQSYIETKSPKTGTFSRKESVGNVHRVGVVGFQVVFSEVVAEQIDGSTWKGLTQGNFSDNRWELEVRNLTPEVRQQITNQMYQELLAQLKESGLTVVPQEEIAQSGLYQAYVQETLTKGKQNDDVVSQTQRATKFGKNTVWAVVPPSFPLEKLDVSSDIFAGAKPGFVDGMKQVGSGFGQASATKAKSRAYHDFSDFTPIAATYYLDFKKLKAIGGFLPGNPFGSSAKDSTFGISASPGSHVRFYTRTGQKHDTYAANYQLNFVLKKPVQTVEPVGLVRFEKENIGAQAFGMAANMAFRQMGMSGIKSVRKVRAYELQIEPSLYSSQASKLLSAVNRMMVLSIAGETRVSAEKPAKPEQEGTTVAPTETPTEPVQPETLKTDSTETQTPQAE